LQKVPDVKVVSTYLRLGQLSKDEFFELKRLVEKAKKGGLSQGESNRLRVLGGFTVSDFVDQQDIKRAKRRGAENLLDGL